MSFRVRLTLLCVLAVAVTVVLASVVSYFAVSNRLSIRVTGRDAATIVQATIARAPPSMPRAASPASSGFVA